MRIALIVEGKTERAFKKALLEFLRTRLTGRLPHLDPVPVDGRIPKGEKLRRLVQRLLEDKSKAADAVIALTDVYTGQPDFTDAADARLKMTRWVGAEEKRFFPHAAQHDFEAWLLPYWQVIQKRSGSRMAPPRPPFERVNHGKPPSIWIAEAYRRGKKSDYKKAVDAAKIPQGRDLTEAARACPELRALLNTILELCEGEPIG